MPQSRRFVALVMDQQNDGVAVGERFRVLSVGALCVIAAACSSGPARTQGAATTSSWSVAPATSSSVTTTTIRRRVTRPARPAVVLVVKGPVTAIGDSVMIDAAPALRTTLPEVTIDAAVDRSAIPGPAILLAGAVGPTGLVDHRRARHERRRQRVDHRADVGRRRGTSRRDGHEPLRLLQLDDGREHGDPRCLHPST